MRLLRALTTTVALLATANAATAVPTYYTFSGKLNFAYDYTANSGSGGFVPALGGYTPGVSTLTTTFLIDTDASNAFYQWYGATNGPYAPPYFQSQVYSGDALPVSGSDPAYASNYTLGFDGGSYGVAYGSKYPGMNPNYAYVFNSGAISSWFVGQTGFYFETYADDQYGAGSSGLWGYTWGDNFELTRISEAPPSSVPEPASLLLLGSGLVGLAARRRNY